jgi:hypothetical protein
MIYKPKYQIYTREDLEQINPGSKVLDFHY